MQKAGVSVGRGERISVATKVIYSLGDHTVNLVLAALTLLYVIFLTDIIGLRPALAGAVPWIGRAVDAFTDPLMGRISDLTPWKRGRRRPYFLIGAIPFGVSFALLWLDVPFGSQLGKFAYYFQAPMAALRYPFSPIRVVTDDGITMQGTQVVISNCRQYADGFPIAPGASPFDGVMDSSIFQGRKIRDYIRYYRAIRKGRHLLEPDVEYYKGRRFLLRPCVEGARIPLQIDGDYLCDLPAEIEVVPEALPIYVPA